MSIIEKKIKSDCVKIRGIKKIRSNLANNFFGKKTLYFFNHIN